MTGKLKVVQGMRPGVVAFPLGYGHWASGARDITIDGQVIKGDARRGVPMHGNAAMRGRSGAQERHAARPRGR